MSIHWRILLIMAGLTAATCLSGCGEASRQGNAMVQSRLREPSIVDPHFSTGLDREPASYLMLLP